MNSRVYHELAEAWGIKSYPWVTSFYKGEKIEDMAGLGGWQVRLPASSAVTRPASVESPNRMSKTSCRRRKPIVNCPGVFAPRGVPVCFVCVD